jgi:diguanylate cyclase (GGDEF)-like protein
MRLGGIAVLIIASLLALWPLVGDLPGNRGAQVASLGITLLTAAALGVTRVRGGRLIVHVTAALSTVSIALSAHAAAGTAIPLEIGFVPVAMYATYFLARAQAVAHLVVIAAAAGVALTLGDADSPLGRWAVTIGVVLGTAAVLRLLRDRIFRLIVALDGAAATDPLTGVLSRRGLEDRLEVELKHCRASNLPCSVLVGDLDRFKAINDRHGHQAGDEALRSIAAILAGGLRPGDAIGRLGGDEFVIVLPAARALDAVTTAERLAAQVSARWGERTDTPLGITFGSATFPDSGAGWFELLDHADRVMLRGKPAAGDRRAAPLT